MTDKARTYSPQVNAERRRAGEIFTPSELVEDMLDRFEPEVWTDPTATFLDPACGDGNFLAAIYKRLNMGTAWAIPDDEERHRNIIERQLFGIELQEDNAQACIERLRAEGLQHNIVCADTLAHDLTFG